MIGAKSLGLWMLFLWVQEGVSTDGEKSACGNYTGTLGKAVELKCCYAGEDLKTNEVRVQWQLKGNSDCVVAACFPDQTYAPQCEHYKNRTEVKQPCLHLRLLNISLEDSKIYECILQRKENVRYQKIFHGLLRLEVAANGSLNATGFPSGLESPTPYPVTDDNQKQTPVIAISCLVVASVIITIIILILYKRKQPLLRAYTAPVGADVS